MLREHVAFELESSESDLGSYPPSRLAQVYNSNPQKVLR